MCDRNFGSVMAIHAARRLAGVVTGRDVMRRVANEGRGADAIPLAGVMTREPRPSCATEDVPDWLRIMSNERVRRLPVVDEEGRVEAVCTRGDFVSGTWPDLSCQARELGKARFARNHALWLIGGGIMLYPVLMVVVVGSLQARGGPAAAQSRRVISM